MIRTQSRVLSNSSLIEIRGTGTAAYDTALLQATIDGAADNAVIDLGNTEFALKTAEPDDPYWYYVSSPARRIYPAVKLLRSNITIRNGRFRHELPDTAYAAGDRPTLFSTNLNLQRNTLRNITFEDLEFDFRSPGAVTLCAAATFLGVNGLRLIRNRYFTSGDSHAVTLTSSSGNLLVNWTAHGYSVPATIRFSGDTLPAVIEPGRDYFIRTVTTDSFEISEESNGTALALASGTYSATAYAIQMRGRCLTIDNCDNVLDDHPEYDHIRQGWFANCNRDVVIDTPRFNIFAEAIDIDIGLTRGKIINPTFTNAFNEGQGLDLSNVVDFQLTGLTADRVTQAYQIYAKTENAENYEEFNGFHYSWPCVFTTGTPGTITSVATATGFDDVPCPITADMRFWIDEPSSAYTMPTGAAIFTTYRAKNVNAATGTFEFYADADGTKTSINLSGSPSGTFTLKVISETADMTVCKNIIVDNVTITNALGTDNDVMISNERACRAGTDRNQGQTGMGVFVQNITLSNHTIVNGTRLLVNEAENITIRDLKMVNCAPGTNNGSGASPGAALALRQSSNDTTAISQSLLSGTVDGVEIVDSQGMGVYASRPENIRLSNIKVDGYNLQASDDTAYGIRGALMADRGGVKTFGEMRSSGGTNGSTVTAVDFWPEIGVGASTGQFNLIGPFDFGSAIKVKGDIGANVGNQLQRVIPSQATSATAIKIPLETDRQRGGKFLYASLQNLDAISGSTPNYSNLRIRKVNSAGTVSNLTSDQAIDSAAVAVATSRSWSVDPTNAATDVAAGEFVYVELTRAGTGSTIPNLLLTYVFVPYL